MRRLAISIAAAITTACVARQAPQHTLEVKPFAVSHHLASTLVHKQDTDSILEDIRKRMGCEINGENSIEPLPLPQDPETPNPTAIVAQTFTKLAEIKRDPLGRADAHMERKLAQIEATVCHWTAPGQLQTGNEQRFSEGMGEWLYDAARAEGCIHGNDFDGARPICLNQAHDIAYSKNGAAYLVYADHFAGATEVSQTKTKVDEWVKAAGVQFHEVRR